MRVPALKGDVRSSPLTHTFSNTLPFVSGIAETIEPETTAHSARWTKDPTDEDGAGTMLRRHLRDCQYCDGVSSTASVQHAPAGCLVRSSTGIRPLREFSAISVTSMPRFALRASVPFSFAISMVGSPNQMLRRPSPRPFR